MQTFLLNLKELFTASRFSGIYLKLLSLVQVYISVFLVILPIWNPTTVNIWLAWVLASLGVSNLFLEYHGLHLNNAERDKRRLIHNLLALLNHLYSWHGKCRITLFTLKQQTKNSWVITPYERTSVGAPPGIDSVKVCFKQGHGIPGLAWRTAWNGSDVNQLAECIQFGDVPPEVLDSHEKLCDYYTSTFKMDKSTYESLGDEKYSIASYMAVGIQNQDMSLAGILVIDSQEYDLFHDFKRMKDARRPSIVQNSLMTLSIQQSPEMQNSSVQVPFEPDQLQKMLDSFAKDVLKVGSGSIDQLPGKIKDLNQLRAASQRLELSPANISAALSPLEWVLKSIRDMRI